MTFRNPLDVLFDLQRRTQAAPLSAFDPSRTGDPMRSGDARPAIGFGDTQIGAPALVGEPRRRPIGFAPPEDASTEPRYRTELSFKRHHEAPRASANADEPNDVAQTPWETPGSSDFDATPVHELRDDTSPVEREAGDKVPFYKREITFRRKRAVPEEAPTTLVVEEDVATEIAALVELADEIVEEPFAADPIEVFAADQNASEPQEDESVAWPVSLAPEAGAEVTIEVEPYELPAFDEGSAEGADFADEPVEAFETSHAGLADAVSEVEFARDATEEVAADDSADEEPHADEPPVSEGAAPSKKRRTAVSLKRPARGAKGKRVVGLKVGASQLAAAVVTRTEAGHELVQLARRPLEAGIVVDGEIRDQDALTNALKAFFDDEKLPKKDVRVGLASNRIGVRTLDIVGIDDDAQFENAVRFKAHEVLPVAVNESVLDYRVLENRSNEAGEPSRRVLLVVAPRDQVEPYAAVARNAGIKLSGIDLEALGLLRAFVDPKPFPVRAVDDTAKVVVSIGHESTTLLVAGGGTCEFTRVFDWGGSTLQDAIAASLEVHPIEAATILRHLSLSGPGRQFDGLDETSRAKALDAVRLRLTPFARELVSSLQFYQTQDESLGIGGIVITGGTSHLEGLGDALHQMIGVNVSLADPLGRLGGSLDIDPAIEATIGSMAVPIGLAIDDLAMRTVDLMPKDAVKVRSTRSSMIAIGAPLAAAAPLVAVGLLYMGAHGAVTVKQDEFDGLSAEIAALPVPKGPSIDRSIVGDEASRATAVASVLGGRIAWDGVFSDLARVLPENVWLEGLSVKKPEGSAVLADATTAPVLLPGQGPPAPTGVSIEGYTYAQPDVARLLARLATLPSLQRVTLTSSGREKIGKKDVIRFVIVADLNQTGGVS